MTDNDLWTDTESGYDNDDTSYSDASTEIIADDLDEDPLEMADVEKTSES
jgi:hypothetical protein